MEKITRLSELIHREIVVAKKTHAQVAEELQDAFPGERGFSTRSVRRFCDRHDIHSRSQLSEQQIDTAVASAISKVSVYRCCS